MADTLQISLKSISIHDIRQFRALIRGVQKGIRLGMFWEKVAVSGRTEDVRVCGCVVFGGSNGHLPNPLRPYSCRRFHFELSEESRQSGHSIYGPVSDKHYLQSRPAKRTACFFLTAPRACMYSMWWHELLIKSGPRCQSMWAMGDGLRGGPRKTLICSSTILLESPAPSTRGILHVRWLTQVAEPDSRVAAYPCDAVPIEAATG